MRYIAVQSAAILERDKEIERLKARIKELES